MMATKIKSSKPPVFVLGLSATGLSVGRIFSARGVQVFGTDRKNGQIGRYSKHIIKPPFGYIAKENSLLDDLIEFSKNLAVKPILIPSDDEFIEFISRNAKELKGHYLFNSSYEKETSEKFLNKKKFYRLCEEHGVAVPKSLYLSGHEMLNNILAEIRFPFIIKPDLIHRWKKKLHGNKVLLVSTAEDFKQVVDKYDGILSQSTIQEVIPGPESNIFLFKGYFSEATGECIADFTGQKILQVPINFGSGSFVKSIINEEVREISKAFLKSCNFRGLCGSEFKYDNRDGKYKMIEVNIRPQLWEDLTRVSLRDVLWYAYADLVGLPDVSVPEQKNGKSWSYFLRDITTTLELKKRTGLSIIDWLTSYKYLSTDAILDMQDPFATLIAPFLTVKQVINYFKGR